jgi:predicted phage terminase large subunit-like protein
MAAVTTEQYNAARTLLKIKAAKDDFLTFCQIISPDPNAPDDPDVSQFQVKPHHRLIGEALMKVQKGECLRLAISMPPQHGKSEQISRLFPAWYMGKQPWKNLMFGTYSQNRAEEEGAQVRARMQHPRYAMVFSGVELRKDSTAKDHQVTTAGGQMAFIGRGGAGTGKPADIFIIDDPLKDDEEAQSDTTREKVYQWFTKVAYTRCHTLSAIIIVHTRWSEDDLIGRLLDPDHPDHDPEIAKEWTYISIPAVVKDPVLADALGLELKVPTDENIIREFCGGNKPSPVSALWEDRFSLRHLATAHRLNKRGFDALYMGAPNAEGGDYFKREDIRTYKAKDLPGELRIYAASDHALSQKTHADPSVLGCVGVDENDDIYVLPDLIWDKIPTDRAVEEMIAMMKRRKPQCWFAESDNIKKSIGPFLRKRMREEKVYVPIYDMATKQADKVMRARSIQGRMQMGKVFFPEFAFWFPKAQNELLKFPNGAHDDFVDWIAWIGLGLDSEHGARGKKGSIGTPKKGTFGWLKAATKRRDKASQTQLGGW